MTKQRNRLAITVHMKCVCECVCVCVCVGGDLYHKRGSIADSLQLSPTHRPDMTEILLKRA